MLGYKPMEGNFYITRKNNLTAEERIQEKNADTSYEIGTILSLGEDQGIIFKQYAYVKIVYYIVFYTKSLISFCRLNCYIKNISKGEILVFPGVITHTFDSQPNQFGSITHLVSKIGHRNYCFEKKGDLICPGFTAI